MNRQWLIWLGAIVLEWSGCPVLAEPVSRSATDLQVRQPINADVLISDTPKVGLSDNNLDLDPELLRSSPVLQRWQRQIPNVLEEIRRDPSFRSRLRLGYADFPSSDDVSGWQVGVEDVFLGRSRVTLSADYAASFNGNRESWGADARYYLLPLGSVVNIAPVIGYRSLTTRNITLDGLNLGVRLLVVPSRTGAVDVALTQSWTAPGQAEEFGQTTLAVGYALTHDLRLSTEFQKQNSRLRQDSRVGIVLEWMF